MRIFSYIILILVILLGISFATLNSENVPINYYLGHRVMPLSMLIALTFVLGCLLGLVISLWLVFKVKIKNYRLKQRLRLAEREVENLRAIPLQDKH